MLKKIKRTMWHIFSSGLPPDHDLEVLGKVVLYNIGIIFTCFLLILFGIIAFLQQYIILGIADFLLLVFGFWLFSFLRKTKNIELVTRIGSIAMALFFSFLIASGSANKTAYVWSFMYPLLSIFVLGSALGSLLSLSFLVIACTLFVLGAKVSFLASYDPGLIIRYAACYVTIWFFSFFMEWIREQVQNRLRASNIELEKAEKELAGALQSSEKLRDEAQAANRAKSEFLANMSHELRTPLNAILGFAQLMGRDQRATSLERNNLDVITRSGEHLLDLINDVLTMSRIEAGRIELDAVPFDLYETLEGVDSMMRFHADNKNLSLRIERDSDVPRYVKTDQAKLRQVLVNLVGNAIKFTENGGVVLRVGCRPHPTRGVSSSMLRFEVEDSGQGIAKTQLQRIFDPFVQTGSGQNPREGTGLGLPISRRYVQLMGGDINVTSKIGKGSVFSFQVEIEPATAADLSSVERFREVVGLMPGQPEWRILIVEDNPQNRALLVKFLQPLGFRIREAVNGQEGVEISEEWDPNLIFMDMRMPVMDGFEATRRIKSDSKGKNVKIVAVTASVFEHERELVMNAGCDDFIRKPIHSREIFETLARHLGVKFRYAKPVEETTEENQKLDDEAVRERLRVLPTEWISRLNNAAVAADIEKTSALLEEISERDRALADTLGELLKQYRLDRIADYTESVESC